MDTDSSTFPTESPSWLPYWSNHSVETHIASWSHVWIQTTRIMKKISRRWLMQQRQVELRMHRHLADDISLFNLNGQLEKTPQQLWSINSESETNSSKTNSSKWVNIQSHHQL